MSNVDDGQSDLYPFFGTMEEAKQLAMNDDNQFEITKIMAHKGGWEKRSEMEFLVLLADGESEWIKYSKDLNTCIEFERYCKQLVD
jgi:hypothetical protein